LNHAAAEADLREYIQVLNHTGSKKAACLETGMQLF
jgi:hypothetical protein